MTHSRFILDFDDYLSYLIEKLFEAEVDRLRLLKELNAEGLLEHLSRDELRLLLLMIANCKDNGEAELHGDEISRMFGRDVTMKRLNDLCMKLEKLHAAGMTSHFRFCATYDGHIIIYRFDFAE